MRKNHTLANHGRSYKATAGLILGLILGHLTFSGLIRVMAPLQTSGAAAWHFELREGCLVLFILLAGALASFVPALRSARLDIGRLLAKGI